MPADHFEAVPRHYGLRHRPPHDTAFVSVRDRDGRRVMAMYSHGKGSYHVTGATPLDVKTSHDTAWALDKAGRQRIGVRRNDEDATLHITNGSGITTLFLRTDGKQWRGEDQEGELRWVLKGAQNAWWMYDQNGHLLGSVRGGGNLITIRDAEGNKLYTITRLEPLAGALWYLNRKNPYVSAALLGAFAAW